ncbi:hypothetical protein DPEC_G00322610 [Dallia pectoralis]|uniref:Uncharacterized protein n=1 Tax=Dallia pectoralis TaxID=75939 RepID=A0ACC2FAD8_DALPE|nr:hypothetical protein DPEC_G00322610 [Dallia pectoralis]
MALGRTRSCVDILLRYGPVKGLLRGFLQTDFMTCREGAKRHLLSEDVVKLQDFQRRKLVVAHQMSGSKSNFFEAFNKKLKKNELILQDELKMLLHLCQSAEDMDTARCAIYRYHEENANTAFGEFKFGPLFMRLCFELGQEEMAASTLTDQNLRGFFCDSTSFNIAVDMLFTKGLYQSALDVLRDMKKQGVQSNKDTFTLEAATCYKLNTPESFKICSALMDEAQGRGSVLPRHAYSFTVALALRQNDVPNAQRFFNLIMSAESRICQNLKVLILAMAGDMKECLDVLTFAISSSSPAFIKKPEFAQEVVDLARLRSKDSPLMASVEQVLSSLQQSGQVTQESLDQMLCHTPVGRKGMSTRLMEDRKISRRTLRPLQSTLLSE